MDRLFDYMDVVKALGAETIGPSECSIQSVIIDSRLAEREVLFVPLVGEVTDGHLYLEGACKKGCRASLMSASWYRDHKTDVDRLVDDYGVTFFLVNDTLKALQLLAKYHIGRFSDLKVITVTGSSGKTTTKEVLGSILKGYKHTLVTEGNYNSETGLPLTVFRIDGTHELALLEIGMSAPGEIKALVDIINPDVSIITNIGSAHIGAFGSRDGIAQEKKDAFANFTGNNLGIIPAWDDYSDFLAKDVHGHILAVEEKPTFISDIKDRGFNGWSFLYEGVEVSYPYMGRYNLKNALLAISCARELGTPLELVVKGLESLPVMFGRGEILGGRNRVIRDCYNANPESSKNSLELLLNTDFDGEKLPVLGDMLELGKNSYINHKEVLTYAMSCFSKVLLYGKEYRKVFEEFDDDVKTSGSLLYFETIDELKKQCEEITSSLVLLKGSRGMRLEELTDSLI